MPGRALVLRNATVITMWPERPRVEDVVIADGRFASVGEPDRRPAGAEVIDLNGRTLLPGFIDSHVHLVSLGLAARSADLTGTRSLAEALERVASHAGRLPPGGVLRAPGFDESAWPERRALTRRDLDRAAPDRPVVAIRVCGHVVVVNTRALEAIRAAAGLSEKALAAAGADIETGACIRAAAQYARAVVEPDSAERLEALAEGCRLALACGITTVHDLSDDAALYVALRAAGRLPLRAYVADHASPGEALPEPLTGATADDRLWAGPVKVFADGSFGAHTAALNEPYADRPDCVGDLYTAPDALAAIIGTAHRAGRQVACHAIGDRGVEVALDAFERVLRDSPRDDHRHRIEHGELAPQAALARMHALGLIASVQPNFAGRWGRAGGLYERRLGRRAQATNPFATMARMGIPVAFGSDGMPLGPLYGIWSAVTHPVASERVTVAAALEFATTAGAFAAFAEDALGQIAPGRRADAVVLADDPTAVTPDAIGDIPVEATLVGGAWAFLPE